MYSLWAWSASSCRWRPTRSFFFFNDTATTEIYTLSLHDALPISPAGEEFFETKIRPVLVENCYKCHSAGAEKLKGGRSEEHTSELQSQSNLVCRLLLEKKKQHGPAVEPVQSDFLSPLAVRYLNSS